MKYAVIGTGKTGQAVLNALPQADVVAVCNSRNRPYRINIGLRITSHNSLLLTPHGRLTSAEQLQQGPILTVDGATIETLASKRCHKQ